MKFYGHPADAAREYVAALCRVSRKQVLGDVIKHRRHHSGRLVERSGWKSLAGTA